MAVIKIFCLFCTLLPAIGCTLYNATNLELSRVPEDIPPNVTTVILSKNLISAILPEQFACFPNLTSVALDANQISNISGSAFCNNATSEIKIARNGIANFPDFTCIGSVLEVLDLSHNDITGLAEELITELTALKILCLADNKINSPNVTSLLPLADTLLQLDLSYNEIQDVDDVFQNFSSLTDLDLSGNNIRRFANDAFLNCTSLKTFRCRSCDLFEFPVFTSATGLTRLNIADNNITNISPDDLSSLPRLQLLNIKNNDIGESGKVIFRWANRSNLMTLNIAKTNIPPTTIEQEAFVGFSSLRSLYMSSLNLTKFPNLTAVAGTLTILDLGANCLSHISGEQVQGLELENLVINKNCFRYWRDIAGIFSLSTTLKRLSLEENQFNDSDPRIWQMSALKELNMKKTTLGCLDQPLLNTTLKKLYLEGSEMNCECACWLFNKAVRVVGDLSEISCSGPAAGRTVDDMRSECQPTATETTVTEAPLTAPEANYLEWDCWLPWTECSRTCNTGTRFRIKVCGTEVNNCTHTLRITTKDIVIGYEVAYANCSTSSCPEDGTWSTWSDWSECRVTCGSGIQLRTRVCIGPYYGGKPCPSVSVNDVRECTTDVTCPESAISQEDANPEPVYTASDERPVAKGIGSLAVIVVLSFGVLIFACDAPTIRRHASLCIQNLKQMERKHRVKL